MALKLKLIEKRSLSIINADEQVLSLDILQPENIRDALHAYQMAKRCNEKRVMAEAVKWGDKGAFITGTDFLIDGGATASYFYGPLRAKQ